MKKKARILMVDDDLDYAEGIRLILEKAGYEFHHARDGKSALAKAAELRPDAIILDVVMNNRVEGFLFAKRLRERSGPLAKAPILVLTGIGRQEGYEPSPADQPVFTASDDFLEKPVKPPALLKAIEAMLLARRKSG